MIRRNYAKSFQGFKTRILSKIAVLTMIQYINKFIFERISTILKLGSFKIHNEYIINVNILVLISYPKIPQGVIF